MTVRRKVVTDLVAELGGWPFIATLAGSLFLAAFQIVSAQSILAQHSTKIEWNSARIDKMVEKMESNTAALNNMQGELGQMHRLIIEIVGEARKRDVPKHTDKP